ncbi:DNA adenine methylase [Paratissierella segnis]|jgi:DNA adenine methylase|uniref:Site-specific DNA-methyltransferase (adenine-specific) n=2 Tax=Bacillota TaxID=1239 RepID=A0A926EZV7_9FIRM|nr:DNA adenine methylase [Paratissierella segnis]MBC8589429.1 DNA adenine methylase [Paratissierella segnis]
MARNMLIQPFLKWAGGKRQLIKEIEKYFPNKISTYYEPFLGGGAVLFYLQPKKAIINDYNADLINTYKVIMDNIEELIENLKKHKNTSEYFYYIRGLDRKPEFKNLNNIEKASRLIYLNKTCYNGLFRVNSQGEFNTPFGNYKNPNIVNEHVLRVVNKYLNENDIRILNYDFEEALKGIRKGSFVYFDPPYMPISDSSSFTGYTLDGFNIEDQIRLKNLCDNLDGKGVKFLLSNSSAPFILDLYKDYNIEFVNAKRSINSIAGGRGEIKEILVKNYDL